jgi:hypothetical protein
MKPRILEDKIMFLFLALFTTKKDVKSIVKNHHDR